MQTAANTRPARWTQVAEGFDLIDGPVAASLRKNGKRWHLHIEGREPIDLGRRASFDHADRIVFAR